VDHDDYKRLYEPFKENVLAFVTGLEIEIEDVPETLLKQKDGNPVPAIRHSHTNYDTLLEVVCGYALEQWGDVPFPCPLRTVKAFVKQRVVEAIAAKYPGEKGIGPEIGRAKTRIYTSEVKNGVWTKQDEETDRA